MNPIFIELINKGMKVGRDTYIDWNCAIDQSHCWLIEIGQGVTLAPYSIILAHDASMNRKLGVTKIARTKIGDDTFIGAGAIILPGVSIGKNCIIGAGSVVTHDVPNDTVVAGNPAVKIKDTKEFIRDQKKRINEWPVFPKKGNTVEDISKSQKNKMKKLLSKSSGYIKSR